MLHLRRLLARGYRRELSSLAARGVGLHFIFGSDGSAEPLLRQQAGGVVDELSRQGRLTISRMPGTDHILSRWHDRQALCEMLAALIEGHAKEKGPQCGPAVVSVPEDLMRARRAA